MSKENKDKKNSPEGFVKKTVVIGFIGGLIWSMIGSVAHYLNFTKISPRIIFEPILPKSSWQTHWQGLVISILLISLLSIGVALIYYVLLRKFTGMSISILFGISLFLIVFYLLNGLFPSVKPLKDLSINTIITTACLYIVYGVFIGFSISYEESEINNGQAKTS